MGYRKKFKDGNSMTNIEMIKGVNDIIEKSLDYAEVTISPNNKFEEIGVNSLLFIKIIAEIETVYEIDIDANEISELYELNIFEFVLCMVLKIKMVHDFSN